MKLNRQYFSAGVNEIITQLNFWHKIHGVLVFDANEKHPLLLRIWWIIFKSSLLIMTCFFLIGTLPSVSSNTKTQRLTSFVCLMMFVTMIAQVLIFASQKKKIKEIANWCHWTEMRPQFFYGTPDNWFGEIRRNIVKNIRIYSTVMLFYGIASPIVTSSLRTVINHQRTLIIDVNIKNHEERESDFAFGLIYTINTFAVIGATNFSILSLTCFIFFSSYVRGQLKLVRLFARNLPLDDVQNCANHLMEITVLHLDTLHAFDSITDLYRVTMKMHEGFLFFGISGSVLGRADLNTTLLSLPFYLLAFVGFYSYEVERIIEIENDIREQYYLLEWYTAPVKIRKLILLAMQKPKNIKFGGVFGKDSTSLARFTEIVRQGYDFGLLLMKLTRGG